MSDPVEAAAVEVSQVVQVMLSSDNCGHLSLCQERQSLSWEKTQCTLPSMGEVGPEYLSASLVACPLRPSLFYLSGML